MISELQMVNFKCFEDQTLSLAPLTLLSGLNSTGKSTVLQALLLLRQSFQDGALVKGWLSLNGELVEIGTAKDALNEWARDEQIGLRLDFTSGASVSFVFAYDPSSTVLSTVSEGAPADTFNESLFSNEFHYIEAERLGPRTSVEMNDYYVRQRRQLGSAGEYALHYLSLFGSQPVHEKLRHPGTNSPTLSEQVEAWMGEISPGLRLHYTAHPTMDLVNLGVSFSGKGEITSSEYRATNVGFGIAYSLPVVVALLSAAPNFLVLLENPEAHVHPRGQVKLAELAGRAASAGIQVLIESHSDHFLNGIRLAVHDGLLLPDAVQLHYFTRRSAGRDSRILVTSPRVDRNGRLDVWPEGFFDEFERALERLMQPVTV